MIEGWRGANEAGTGDCEICGEKRELRIIHYNGPPGTLSPKAKDHLDICKMCFIQSDMKNWHACGCGG